MTRLVQKWVGLLSFTKCSICNAIVGVAQCMRAIPCPIPRDELRGLYEIQKLTDQQIVDRIGGGTTVKHVRSWRKRFGIETLARTARHDVPPIDGELRSLLVGSMLGDGRLVRRVHSTHYSENHSAHQSEYAEWKRQQWGTWVKNELKPVIWKKENGDYPGVRFETVAHESLNEWHSFFYPVKGSKLFPSEVVSLVDPFALAIWYMDDGCAEWWPTFTMATVQRSAAFAVLTSFGLTPEWGFSTTRSTTGFYALRGEDNAHRFIDLVKPHIPECMQYKLDFGFQGPHYQARQSAPEQLLEKLAGEGRPIRQIARELGIGASTVDRYLRGYGIAHPRKIGRPTA